ncbi:MAG: inosine-5-monophosphate dehydrogenase [Bdellovibrionales bacterium RIFCSPHIGHO2_01_FULL_40_29]|nr:MAG: inosine-5-monophosphate dehydrogenase [Bdellovibrionales bacterium RIFCSPHIGHO2_01_FULL_40_29]OFZ33573.1 MAG: inosine-5-monophosphate dehydrogenase [Bdellovibrionales bacterium RIFCSPHIGHO2_02_FULL_40_15]
MLVKECMSQNVELGNPTMTLTEIAKRMRDRDFGMMPIAENDRLIGMVTDRDIAVRATAEGKNPNTTYARDVMSKDVLYCYEDQSTDEVSHNLGENQVRRLPVLNRQKRLVGILSLGDLAQSSANPIQIEKALSDISKPANEREAIHPH